MDLARLDIEVRAAGWLQARGARRYEELTEADRAEILAWWLVRGQRGDSLA